MKKTLVLLLLLGSSFLYCQESNQNWDAEMVEVTLHPKQGVLMSSHAIFHDKWDHLSQPLFWRKVMVLSPDSCLINVATTREVLLKMSNKEWKKQTEEQKALFKDSLRTLYNIPAEERILVTVGKNDFYRFNDVYPSISQGILAFEKYGVDPWYAQAILLIESPGQLKKSTAGAYGPFQLMPGVARSMGLKVTKTVDERKDFDRSAYGASRLIQRICIPEAKKILNAHNIQYNETDLWFRLFVMHVYHAGAGNVRAVVNKISPTEGGQQLIVQMWQTSAASFGNSSQNYSQLALASQLILHDMFKDSCVRLFDCVD
jgi:hypothetical protein